jgi:ADP-ribosylglycohydrolase
LLAHSDNVKAFQRSLAWKLRLWLLGAPAGIGLATLKAILKLWIGFSPGRSGVFSAGNGPAMRSAIIGAYFADDTARRCEFVSASTRITHTDPRAERAALAVAEAAAWAVESQHSWNELLGRLRALSPDPEWLGICEKLAAALGTEISVAEFAASLGLSRGVTGFAYHSVPVALFAFLRHESHFCAALTAALNCGGDTDTVGAITGALCGAVVGERGIPEEWASGIWDWPRSPALLGGVGERLAAAKRKPDAAVAVSYFWPVLILRNAMFLVIVLAHGFRRLLPPYL